MPAAAPQIDAVTGSNPPNGTAIVIGATVQLSNADTPKRGVGQHGPSRTPVCIRFWEKVQIGQTCWTWTGDKTNGYGRFWFKGQNISAHRYSYETQVGPIPEGLLVCHHCDNPSCVRPSHLFVGTQKENLQDCISKGRYPTGDKIWQKTQPEKVLRGERAGNSKLTEAQAITIWSMANCGMLLTEVADLFDISFVTVSSIKRGKTWQHATRRFHAT